MTNFHVILTESERDDVVTALVLAFTILRNRRDGLEIAAELFCALSESEIKAFETLATKVATIQ